MSTLRMKCFWGPYICIFASVCISHFDVWSFIVSKMGGRGNKLLVNFLRHIIIVFALFSLQAAFKPGLIKELENLR